MTKKKDVIKVACYICLSMILVFSLMTIAGCGGGGDDGVDGGGAYIPLPPSLGEHTADGNFNYDPETGTLTVTFTSSDFQSCGPEIGTEQFTVTSITETIMILIEENNDKMTWTRDSGTIGNIIGTWDFVDEHGNSFEVDLNADGSIFIFGNIIACEDEGGVVVGSDFTIPRADITIDGKITDWALINPVFIDAVNDEDPQANFNGTDLYKFYLARDDTFLYLMITLYDGNPNPAAQYTFEMQPTPDEGGETGDYLALAYNTNDSWYSGVHVRNVSSLSYPSDYVGIGEGFIEWKVKLSDIQFFDNRYIVVYIHDYSPIFYPVSDYAKPGIRVHLE